MKKIIFCFSLMFFLNSCLPVLLIERHKQKEVKKAIEIVKKSHFKSIYFGKKTIDQVLKKVSNNRYNWRGLILSNKIYLYCTIQITYTDRKTFETQRFRLTFYFDYNKDTQKFKLIKIVEYPSNKEYSTKLGIDYIMQSLYVIYLNPEIK